jgi:benzoate membrane transport protein
MEHVSRPVLAGILTALVGFTSSFAVVLAGLRGVGASPAEAASGLLAVCATQALGVLWLVRRHRIPLTLAWSTPGAALLASTGVVHGGWPAAVGAFLVTGALLVITGLWPRLGRLIAAIPTPIAQAMLAGVVLELCLAPVRGFAAHPWLVGPILLTWAVMLRLARRWAVPAAFAATLAVIAVDAARASQQGHGGPHGALVPHLAWTAPTLTWASLLGLAIPLYVVTMAGQNIPGVAVMASYGYQVPWRETMTVTGLGTAAGATAGGHAINLAAITAAMAASPDADPDPARRWVASWTAGWSYLVLALFSTALVAFISVAPPSVAGTVAGLALLGTLSASLASALSATEGREAAAITFVVAASGLTFAGIGAAFWALAAGLLIRTLLPREPKGDCGRPKASGAKESVAGLQRRRPVRRCR